ncbi:homocysteine S-methyltransferase family protein [Thalassorhabdomicrobium marinisediminis]|uniref:Homocysteine S-methyltransferase n=1 Tax=Thalassorhabdomicrobium marinisediminis TaxID=2170577 RepID=A0A2T7G092_9RHOB|nr:homocysteine S-methyltransferase family protein [Thalassorhabdomicrobium marinisediminis]PVA07843.1 homocysteine S-methyltransferase [Thalassorhabdomicrobium marinisediminis]
MAQITLLDGGMGQELVHRAGDRPTPLWSTQVMLDHPGLVTQVHRDFTRAGATVATTNTYAIHRDRLPGTGLADRFEDLHQLALDAAQASGAPRIAGSIGPLVASYRTDVMPDHAEAVEKFAEVAQILAPPVDLLLCETVVSLAQTRAILEGARTTGKPVWIGFSVSDRDGSKLRSGEPLAEAVAAAESAQAVLVNCSAPEAIPAALDVLATSGKPYGAYPNGFEQITEDFLKDRPTVDALSKRRDFTPALFADHAMAWVDHGATIIGGCCEVSPAHIAEIADRLRAAGHAIV